MLQRKVVFAGALAVLGALSAVILVWARPARAQEDYIRTPDRWVPYTVEKQHLSATDGVVSAVITEHRSSDGSLMTVQHHASGTADQITITNRRTGTFYRFANGTWVAQPAPAARHPRTLLDPTTVTRVSASDERIAAVAHLGLPVYEHRNPKTGTVNLLCPDLHLLAAWADHPKAGLQERVTKIVLGEPPVTFTPPADAQVELNQRPVGPGVRQAPLSQTAPRTPVRP